MYVEDGSQQHTIYILRERMLCTLGKCGIFHLFTLLGIYRLIIY